MASWVVTDKGRCPFCACTGKTMCRSGNSIICIGCAEKIYRCEWLPRMKEWLAELEAKRNPNEFTKILTGLVREGCRQHDESSGGPA